MSLSKELCLRSDSQNSDSFSDCFRHKIQLKEDNYRRDSFDDRFCDDLCEEILQYLSLEDKLRLECVSKQFQRTVFQRQYELYINVRQRIYLSNRFTDDYNHVIEVQTFDSIKVLLKKCPNITSILCDGRQVDDKLNEVFQLIIENCNNLSKITLIWDINESNLEEFQRKFGPKIKTFGFFEQHFDLNRFPNIEKALIAYLFDDSMIAKNKLAKLKKLETVFDEDQEPTLQTIIENFPTLTHLSIDLESRDENVIYKSLKYISNLKHLIYFRFHNEITKIDNRFSDLLKQMANNCQNLKSIDYRIIINDRNSDIRQLLSQMKTFPALKRLNMYFSNNEEDSDDSDDEDSEQDIDVNQLFSFELFKGFSNIIHLSIRFNQTLNESILKEIDINLPKLQYLEIKDTFNTTPEGVTQMADILSRLSRLQIIHLKFKSGVDFKPIEDKIPEKCRKIKTIEIKSDLNDRSIDSESD